MLKSNTGKASKYSIFGRGRTFNGPQAPGMCLNNYAQESRIILPSVACGGCTIPNIDANPWKNVVYPGDAKHIVVGNPSRRPLIVFLPGTGTNPEDLSCILDAMSYEPGSGRRATIGLRYEFLNSNDGTRNARCATTIDTAACLKNQHEDAIYGGNQQPGLWQSVNPSDSISGRLEHLLNYLHKTFPTEGWSTYLTNDMKIRWDRIYFSGHSQGGAHTAYLARTLKLAGAAPISAPQDSCIGCPAGQKIWTGDGKWATSDVRAFSHGRDDSNAIIQKNWKDMTAVGVFSSNEFIDVRFGFGLENVPTNIPWLSYLTPSDLTTSGRPEHDSVARDKDTPVSGSISGANDEVLLTYAVDVWPALVARK